VSVDLGYRAKVRAVILHVEGVDPDAPVQAALHIADAPGVAGLGEATRCAAPAPLPATGFLGTTCERTGRFASVEVVGQQTVTLCDLEVYIQGELGF
jgi:hypothetical protein